MFDIDKFAIIERSLLKDYRDKPLLFTPDTVQNEILKYTAVRMSETSFF